jgi:hypothetical protein
MARRLGELLLSGTAPESQTSKGRILEQYGIELAELLTGSPVESDEADHSKEASA